MSPGKIVEQGKRDGGEEKPLTPGLYIVATPIGNLEDITLRALRVLRAADVIACEDTRQTQKLLTHFGIVSENRGAKVVSYHEHNEAERAERLLAELSEGAVVALVSDAGMPGISDPGAVMVKAAIEAGVAVFPIPGANAGLTALVASGLDAEEFRFLGFLPPRRGERRTLLEKVRGERMTLVFYEAPHRVVEALEDVVTAMGAGRRVVLARELTKIHEEFLRGTAEEVRAELAGRENIRGEMVLLIAGAAGGATVAEMYGAGAGAADLATRVETLMKVEGLEEREALKRAAKEFGVGKSEAYREWQRRKRG
jgi:16S rRNA (cytidine1402-2'-O)-methyltransferase